MLDGDDTELRGGDGGEGAVLCADGGSGGGDDVHGVGLWAPMSVWPSGRRRGARTIMRACLMFCDKRRREVCMFCLFTEKARRGGESCSYERADQGSTHRELGYFMYCGNGEASITFMHANSHGTAQPLLYILTTITHSITSTRESGFTLPGPRKHPSIPASHGRHSPYLPKKGIRLCASVYENTSLGPTTRI